VTNPNPLERPEFFVFKNGLTEFFVFPTSVSVHDHFDICHISAAREKILQIAIFGLKRQVANKDLID
jgi:hypothetical protein